MVSHVPLAVVSVAQLTHLFERLPWRRACKPSISGLRAASSCPPACRQRGSCVRSNLALRGAEVGNTQRMVRLHLHERGWPCAFHAVCHSVRRCCLICSELRSISTVYIVLLGLRCYSESSLRGSAAHVLHGYCRQCFAWAGNGVGAVQFSSHAC